MKFIIALAACYASIGKTTSLTYCPAQSKSIQDCSTRYIDKLSENDLEIAMRYIYEKKGWVRASCGAPVREEK